MYKKRFIFIIEYLIFLALIITFEMHCRGIGFNDVRIFSSEIREVWDNGTVFIKLMPYTWVYKLLHTMPIFFAVCAGYSIFCNKKIKENMAIACISVAAIAVELFRTEISNDYFIMYGLIFIIVMLTVHISNADEEISLLSLIKETLSKRKNLVKILIVSVFVILLELGIILSHKNEVSICELVGAHNDISYELDGEGITETAKLHIGYEWEIGEGYDYYGGWRFAATSPGTVNIKIYEDKKEIAHRTLIVNENLEFESGLNLKNDLNAYIDNINIIKFAICIIFVTMILNISCTRKRNMIICSLIIILLIILFAYSVNYMYGLPFLHKLFIWFMLVFSLMFLVYLIGRMRNIRKEKSKRQMTFLNLSILYMLFLLILGICNIYVAFSIWILLLILMFLLRTGLKAEMYCH